MPGLVMLVLLCTTSAIVVGVVLVFVVVSRHARHVERLALQTRALLEQVQQNVAQEPPPEGDGAPRQ